jgi:2-polyprenyl-3-methyl-5-hydroxy-6-metoxy-1,4-benzoquinol methylase
MIRFREKDPAWYGRLYHRLKSRAPHLLFHLEYDKPRLLATLQFLERFHLQRKKICEIGIGGVGVACAEVFNSQVDGYDYPVGEQCKRSKTLSNLFSIPFYHVDLNQTGIALQDSYDAILLCEVMEHLVRMPLEVVIDLKNFLKPGGLIFVSTPNLLRLSNRLRLLQGRKLFHDYLPQTYHGHMREYTPEEVAFILQRAGLVEVGWTLKALPDINKSRWLQYAYKRLCLCNPRFSNSIFCWGRKLPEISRGRGDEA